MFFKIFDFILECFSQIFQLLKNIEIFPGFSLLSIPIALFFTIILGYLIDFITGKDSD